jgi:hypothetical protein
MSFFWGTLWYLYSANQLGAKAAPKSSWNCGPCSWDHIIAGAVAYNGGGDPAYGAKIRQALKLSGCKKD